MPFKTLLNRKLFNFIYKYPSNRFNYEYSTISHLLSKPQSISKSTIKGWIKAIRKMKGLVFLDVDDGSSYRKLQVVLAKEMLPGNLSFGSSVEIDGVLSINSQNQVELKASSINVLGPCDLNDGYPFLPRKTYDSDYVRQYLHLRPRTNSFSSLLRLRHYAASLIRKHLDKNGFFEVHTPILTSNDCEGAGETFNVKPSNPVTFKSNEESNAIEIEEFFGEKTYLTVSGQLHLEVMVRSLNSVYNFGPIFRAENSKSRLHLSEFYMLEVEKAFISNIESLLNIMEKMLKEVLSELFDKHKEEIENYQSILNLSKETHIDSIINNPFGILTYQEACQIVNRNADKLKQPLIEKEGLRKEHELFLVKLNNNVPVFVVEWPKEMKPFYMKVCPNDSGKVAAVDLLCPVVGELCGGSLREDNYSRLSAELEKSQLQNTLDWYLELRKYGNVPSAGFGMGFERFLQMAFGIINIKDSIPFPRSPHNCKL